ERALRIDPKYAKAHYALSLELLREGRYAQGWAGHEWRWLKGDYTTPRREFGVPQWDGMKAEGKVLLIHREQGLGDAIQFARFIPLVAGRIGRVMVECHPAMVRLMRAVEGVDEVVAA